MAIAAIVVIGAALIVGLTILVRTLRSELGALREESASRLAERNAEVERRLQGMNETIDRRLEALDTKVDRRLEDATKTTSKIHERLGKVDEATAQMLERARDLQRLEQALRPPKARGGFGELLLENLLRDQLPPEAYETQYGFRSGERVDAVIRVDKLVPVDAKFPLDNWERMLATEHDGERQVHEKAFARDVKAHVDAIAAKYIRPAEGTFEFAFMYVPAEAVYYELVAGRTGALLAYAHEKRVFPVSPTTITAYLQVIVLGLRGMQIERHAHEVMAYVAELERDFGRFREDFELVGKHLGNAQTKFDSADRRLDKLGDKLEHAVERDAGAVSAGEAVAELPRALDAA